MIWSLSAVFPFELRKRPGLSVEEINTAREEEASKGGGVIASADTCGSETNADIRMEGAEEGTAGVILRPRGLGNNIMATTSQALGAMKVMEERMTGPLVLVLHISVGTRASRRSRVIRLSSKRSAGHL